MQPLQKTSSASAAKKAAIENEMLADAGRSGIRITEVEIGAYNNRDLLSETR
jgi:hypothetical protein